MAGVDEFPKYSTSSIKILECRKNRMNIRSKILISNRAKGLKIDLVMGKPSQRASFEDFLELLNVNSVKPCTKKSFEEGRRCYPTQSSGFSRGAMGLNRISREEVRTFSGRRALVFFTLPLGVSSFSLNVKGSFRFEKEKSVKLKR